MPRHIQLPAPVEWPVSMTVQTILTIVEEAGPNGINRRELQQRVEASEGIGATYFYMKLADLALFGRLQYNTDPDYALYVQLGPEERRP